MGAEPTSSTTEKPTVVFVGWQWAVETLRDRFKKLGYKTLRRDPMRMRRRFGDRRPKGPDAPECDVVILTGRDPDEFQWECVDRPELYAGRLVLDMTFLDDLRAYKRRDKSLIEQIEALVPTARAVAVGSAETLWRLLLTDSKERVYFCGRDDGAKAQADAILRSLGFDTEDIGGRRKARLLQLISALYGRDRPYELRPRDAFVADDQWKVTAAEAEDLARVELRAERITDAKGPTGRREWIRWHVGTWAIDLLGVPDKDGYVLARRLFEWEEALHDEHATQFEAEVMSERGKASLGHRHTSHTGILVLLAEAQWMRGEFMALVTTEALRGLLAASRALLGVATAASAKPPALPTTLFAWVEGGRLVVEGASSLPEGTRVQLAPATHIEQEGHLTRIHAPVHFDLEVFHVPTDDERDELDTPNTPYPEIEVTGGYQLPANGWAHVTIRVGQHAVNLRASDAADPPVTYALHRMVAALENDDLPFRDRGDEEDDEVSIGIRRTSRAELVILSVSNLASASLEALVPRDELLKQLKLALAAVASGEWMR